MGNAFAFCFITGLIFTMEGHKLDTYLTERGQKAPLIDKFKFRQKKKKTKTV